MGDGDRDDNVTGVEEDTLKDKYLTFSIAREVYGIELKYVIEIVGIQTITEIPELPDYIKGIVNLRGRIIPVVDARLRFKKEPKDYNDRTCIIVIDIKGVSLGLIVDTVLEVIAIPERDVVEPPKIGKDVNNICIKKIGKVGNDIKLLIDCERLLSEDELIKINEVI